MRSILFAALMFLPTLAAAQTPADLTRLTWPLGASAVAATAPRVDLVTPSGGTANDLARLAGVTDTRIINEAAPASQPVGAGTAADLVSLLAGRPLISDTPTAEVTRVAGIQAPRR